MILVNYACAPGNELSAVWLMSLASVGRVCGNGDSAEE